MLQLHNGTSMPYSVLAAEPIPLHDINLVSLTFVSQALNVFFHPITSESFKFFRTVVLILKSD